ncbi:MAG: aminotransferase class I/II-fold pyridoxal phosphate-dependent enzyme [Candidatus Kerfeldbacteria bacterium]|nr:aminotransferase class I/II-fold pyridoxal phosphate-dependent enzyme [Candidatus Kerfeldbacteria bacterium]
MDIQKLCRSDLNKFFPWPVLNDYLESKEYQDNFIKLDTGESSYDIDPGSIERLKNIPVKYYPGVTQELVQLIAQKDNVAPGQIFLGNGSKDILMMINRLFLNPGDAVITVSPTYPLYSYFIELDRGQVVDVPRLNMTELNLPAIKQAITSTTKVIIIDNPSNPFGYVVPPAVLRQVLDLDLITVVDEAYYEFCGETAVPMLKDYPNLIVVRTFSKLYGLAGLRLGYSISSPEIYELFVRVKIPHQVTVLSQYVAKEVMKSLNTQERLNDLLAGRDYLLTGLRLLPYLETYDSHGAYIVSRVNDAMINIDQLYDYCYQHKILFKKMDFPTMTGNYIRFNVPPLRQAEQVMAALKNYAV